MTNKLILGTVQLGLNYGINNTNGKPSLAMAFKILSTAWDKGIRILDTAEAYGNSQEVIGEFHKANPDKIFKIITKLSPNTSIKQEDLLAHLKTNLKLLHVTSFHGYMFHSFKSYDDGKLLYETLNKAKDLGLIKRLGVSLHSNTELEKVLENQNIKLIQLPFNLLDNHSKRAALLIKAKSLNVEVHTRSVFLQGLFFKSPNDILSSLEGFITPLNELSKLKESYGLKTEVLCLQYALQKDYIDNVLIGVDNVEQLINNINICNNVVKIPTHNIDKIDVKNELLLNPANWK